MHNKSSVKVSPTSIYNFQSDTIVQYKSRTCYLLDIFPTVPFCIFAHEKHLTINNKAYQTTEHQKQFHLQIFFPSHFTQ